MEQKETQEIGSSNIKVRMKRNAVMINLIEHVSSIASVGSKDEPRKHIRTRSWLADRLVSLELIRPNLSLY